ncbi:hypothetical protein CROQUDRAFT_134076 [Cronartium quercuum f. sp. fusiforme G11]|uniref:Uncharacterized protein n=1 Tax=Cronartium quercuum f. sp. fusiforme G11 TaxID=708437 RepID=A0A9P6NFD4_9BASI|nr:hypothetical protein CROQUDRAFT_134076 [Cronartium quercuum f. sp. fusiforme G11]
MSSILLVEFAIIGMSRHLAKWCFQLLHVTPGLYDWANEDELASKTHSNLSKAKWPWTNTKDQLDKKYNLRLEQKPGSQAKLSWFMLGSNNLTKPNAELMNKDIKAHRLILIKKRGSSGESGLSSSRHGSPLDSST